MWGSVEFSSVQLLSHVQLFATPWITARQASLSITISRSSPKLMCIELVMPSSHLILCCPLLLLPPIPPSIRVFSNESTLRMRWPKYWSFSLSISPSNEHPGLVSFRMDWLDLLAVQGTHKSLLQHHSSKASILRCSAFFTVQLSHPYMTTGKTIALPRWTFVGEVISLLFNMLSRLVIIFLPRSKSESEVAQLGPTLCDPMDCSLSGSLVHEIFQAKVLEWVAISFSTGSSWPRDRTQVSHISGRHFTVWATRGRIQRWVPSVCLGLVIISLYHLNGHVPVGQCSS